MLLLERRHLATRLLQPERLRSMLTALAGRRADRQVALDNRIAVLASEAEFAEEKLRRLYEVSASRPTQDISLAAVDRFARAMREKLSSGEIPFRKAYIRSIVDRIEVDDRCIRILGRKDVLEQAVLANGAPLHRVRTFVPKWRTRQDSNL